jgi:hypothetical protein
MAMDDDMRVCAGITHEIITDRVYGAYWVTSGSAKEYLSSGGRGEHTNISVGIHISGCGASTS